MHAIQHGLKAGIISAPKVVGDCNIINVSSMLLALADLQDIETVGPSAVVPGIVIKLEPWPASAHAIRKLKIRYQK